MPDHADNMLRANLGIENLNDTLFGQVIERFAQLFRLGRVFQLNTPQNLRREVRQSGKAHLIFLRQSIAHAQSAVVGNADNVARFRRIGNLAVLREKQDRRVDCNRLAKAGRGQFHAALKRARDLPHKGNPVAVVRVHIGLNLEDEAGHLAIVRRDLAAVGGLRARRRCVFGNRLDQFGHAEILERRAEIDRR